jgi:hypothetical protein
MTVTFEFVQDFRKYREYITYVTKPDEAIGKLPFQFYQGDMLDCFVIEKKDDIVTVIMSTNTQELAERFLEDAQPDSFESIPENVAYMYDLERHELIYNYDAKKVSTNWNWSAYPETFWMTENDRYDHGLVLGEDDKLCRLYLSNERLTSLFVGLHDVEDSFPSLVTKDKTDFTLQPVGVHTVLSILAAQFGKDEPKMEDVKTAIACDLVRTGIQNYASYNVKDVVNLFELRGNEDDLWEDTWGTAMSDAIARDDDLRKRTSTSTTLGELDGYTNQLCMSALAGLSEVPSADRPTYVHMDIQIHGVHYMMIEPGRTLVVFFDDLIIKPEGIYQHLENLPQDQIALHGDYMDVEDDGDDADSFEDRFNKLNGGG